MNKINLRTILPCCMLLFGTVGTFAQDALTQTHLLVAHRGGKYEVDENTMQGFRSAYNSGLRAFETDFRITKDSVIVINHDGTLARMFNDSRTIESITLDELRKLRTSKGNQAPTAEEFFDYFADKDYLYIECEMKTNSKEANYSDALLRTFCRKLYTVAMAKKPAHSVYVFTSFDKRPLRIMRELFPDAKTTYITDSPVNSKSILDAIDVEANCVAGNLNGTTRNDVVLAHKAKLTVSLWQTNSPETWLRAQMLGADLSTCDSPAQTLKWLQENCKWIKYKYE